MPSRYATPAGNFSFLAEHDPLLLRLCVAAERNYHDDPKMTVVKLRQFGDAVVKHLAAVFDITASAEQSHVERLPCIAVTVDLLTTGIDVPPICNFVVLRRVRNRIPDEQMLGRATRPSTEIDNEVFRIFDAADFYTALDPLNTMKPVVQSISIPLAQLFDQITDEKSHQTPGSADHQSHANEQIIVRIRCLLRRVPKHCNDWPGIEDALDLLEPIAGVSLKDWPEALKKADTAEITALIKATPQLIKLLEGLQLGGSGGFAQIISTRDDELISVEPGYCYGKARKPEDYLDAFRQFIADNRNRIAALNIALTRPMELTREHLKQLKLSLAENEFNQAAVRTAWREANNEDIAAKLHRLRAPDGPGVAADPVRGSADRALTKILASRYRPLPLTKWLERIAKSLKHDLVLKAETFEHPACRNEGGFKRLQHIFDGKAQTVLDEFENAVWADAA